MHKRKRPSRSEDKAPASDSGIIKKPFKTRPLTKKKAKAKLQANKQDTSQTNTTVLDKSALQWRSHTEQSEWLTSTFQSVFGTLLSPSELEPISGDRVVQLPEDSDHSVEKLGNHVRPVIGPTWKESLCNENKVGDPGSPVVLVLCSSAIRCVELLRGMKNFTGKVKPVKLFAKHIKLEEQVKLLESHVNIAAGTPNRVRKLMDIGALGVGRLQLVILDMHCDAKGLTLLSVPQVKTEFWELYRTHLHQRILGKETRICLY